ncbi:GGDEF domain-containing protein [Afifella sp. YEN Y35]|uniref:GGDEF domain-containing protein n=1 Tax=Afifella sp. YEN Y35 TaxID=3388337 RepID=UPI0039DF94D0
MAKRSTKNVAGSRGDYVPDTTPVVAAPSASQHPAAGATAQAILTEIGETVYEWDLATDKLRWASNAAGALGIPNLRKIENGRDFDTLVDPDSLMNRTQAVRHAIAVDYGDGVPYEVTYALRVGHEGNKRKIWVRDRGRWYGNHEGEPVLARGAVRVQPAGPGDPQQAERPRFFKERAHFLRLLEDTLAVSQHYAVPFILAVVSIDNLKLAAETYGPQIIDPILQEFSTTIEKTVRDTDVVGELTEGEIGIILNRIDPQEAETAVQRIAERMMTVTVPLRDRVVVPVVSVGALVVSGTEADSMRDCLDAVRRALVRAQKAGGGHLVIDRVDEPGAGEPQKAREDDVDELLRTVREGRLILSQIPVREAETGKTVFLHLAPHLLNEDGDLVPAGKAVDRAEGLGFAQLVDMRLLYLARERLAAAPKQRFCLGVSTGALLNEVWLANLERILRETSGAPDRLIIAVPFDTLLARGDEAADLVESVRTLGAKLAVRRFDGRFWDARPLGQMGLEFLELELAQLRMDEAEAEDRAWTSTADLVAAMGLKALVSGTASTEEEARLAKAGFPLIEKKPA